MIQRKRLILCICILGMFLLLGPTISEAGDPPNNTVYLIHAIMVQHSSSKVAVDRIEVEKIQSRDFYKGGMVCVRPIHQDRFGKLLIIPLFNIRVITQGSTAVLGHDVKER